MALNPATRYPTQVDVSDPTGYPYGKAQNVTAPGDGNGTPYEKDILNDTLGFHQSVLALDDLTPTGTPEKVGASQYVAALFARFGNSGAAALSTWNTETIASAYIPIALYDSEHSSWFLGAFYDSGSSGKFSRDGVTWVASTGLPDLDTQTTPISGAASDDGVMLLHFKKASASTDRIYRSTDGGATWAAAAAPTSSDDVHYIIWTGSRFCLISEAGLTWTSDTGAAGSWTSRGAVGLSSAVHGLVWDVHAGFIVIANKTTGNGQVYVSEDNAATWATVSTVASAPSNGLCWSHRLQKWVALGTTTVCLSDTPDPTGTWTQSAISLKTDVALSRIRNLVEAGGVLVTTAEIANSTPTMILHSYDGINWLSSLYAEDGRITSSGVTGPTTGGRDRVVVATIENGVGSVFYISSRTG